MPSYLPQYTLRIPEDTMNKLKYIAERSGRSANKEMEFALERYVEAFEERHGEVQIEGDDL